MSKRLLSAVVLAILLPVLAQQSMAQVQVTVGTGTSSNVYPINYVWWSSVSESVYSATELAAGGWVGGGGTVTQVAWNVASTSTFSNGTLYIYLENTSASTFTSGTFSTGGTLCYTAPAPAFTVAGWYTFNLTTPFTYTGGNLAVRVVKAGTAYSSGPNFYYTATTGTTHRYWYDDVTTPSAFGTLDTYRPNIRMMIVPGGDPLPSINITSAPSCYSAPTNQNVVATITDNGSIVESRIWFRKGTGTWYSATPTSVVGTTYTFTINTTTMGGVATNDVVSWYLAAKDNSNGMVTSPMGGSGASTPIGSTPPSQLYSYTVGSPRTMPYVETFDGAPSGVTFGGTASTWRTGAPVGIIGTTAYSGATALCNQTTGGLYNNGEQSWAQLPAMDFTGLVNDPVITFWTKYDYESGWDGLRVEVSTNCGSTWTTLGSFADPNGVNWYNAASVNSSGGQPVWAGQSTSWTKSIRTLTGMKGKSGVLIRFFGCSDGSMQYSGSVIDDIAIGDFPQKDLQLVDTWLTYAPNRWAFIQGQTHQAKAIIRNGGWEANPTSVSITLNVAGTPITETFTPVWVGGVATITFNTPIVPPITGTISGTMTINYTGDMNLANNSLSRTYTIDNIQIYGREQFTNTVPPVLPRDWTFNDLNGGVTWVSGSAAGENFLRYPGGATGNDWVFTPAALLQAGSSYRLQFQYRSGSGTQVLDVAYGTAPNPAAMNVFETFTFSNPSWTNAIGALGVAPYFNTDPSGAQNYYIGFRVRSGVVGELHVDNVVLDVNPTPPPKIGIGLPGTAQGSHIDNIATPVQIAAVYKKPGEVSRTFEVVSTTYNYGAPGDFLWDVSTTTPWLKVTKSTPGQLLYLASNPYNPARPRQGQTFTLIVNPFGLAPGTYTGTISLVASLFNAQYPGGIKATNEIFNLPVVLTITDPNAGAGASGGQTACLNNLSASATPYVFRDGNGVPMAAVTVTSGSIPSMCITQYSGQLPPGIARYRYVQKYFTVQASGTFTANIDWYYTTSEAVAGGVTRVDLLRNVRQNPSGGVWQDPIFGVTSTSFPMMNYVRGTGYNASRLAGNHCLVTDWFTPKEGVTALTYELGQNYPNPFNPSTTIDFAIPSEEHVELVVLNSLGAEVARLVDEVRMAGAYSVSFDASALPSGLYMYRLRAGSFTRTLPMTLTK